MCEWNEKEYTITVVAHNPMRGDRPTFIKELECNETTTLMDVFETIPNDAGYFTLDAYYGIDDYWIMLDNKCPYLCTSTGKLWNVPYEQATVNDFIKTHGLRYKREIIVDVDNIGGAGDYFVNVVIPTWFVLVQVFQSVETFKGFIHLIRSTYGHLKHRAPTVENIRNYIYTQDVWEIEELAGEIEAPDDLTIELLKKFGYVKHEGKYYKDAWRVKQCLDKIEKMDYKKYINSYYDLSWNVPEELEKSICTNIMYIEYLCDEKDRQSYCEKVHQTIEEKINVKKEPSFEDYEDINHYLIECIEQLEDS